MKTTKIMVALVMVACVFATAVYADASDADPASAPEMYFWAYENGQWVAYPGSGYYAGEAIADSDLNFTWGSDTYYGTTLSGADFTYQYQSGGVTYTNINPFYGKIATVNNSSDFTIYRYANGNWNPISSDSGLSVMGFYRPYSDYNLQTANIAFVPNDVVSPNPLPTTGLATVETVTATSDYEVTFNVNDQTYVGYGSDCAIAFKDAMIRNGVPYTVNLNVISNGVINNSYYGEVTQIGNQAKTTTYNAVYNSNTNTTSVTATYGYFALYDANETMSNFMLGFISPLSFAPLTGNEFYLEYDDFTYSWTEAGNTTGNYP